MPESVLVTILAAIFPGIIAYAQRGRREAIANL
jgi:hypothetical protein